MPIFIEAASSQCPGVQVKNPVEGEPVAVSPALQRNSSTNSRALYDDSATGPQLNCVFI